MLPNAPMNEWQIVAMMCAFVAGTALVLYGANKVDEQANKLQIFTSLGVVVASFAFLAACGILVIAVINAIRLAVG
jgi:hypothetical protein